MSKRITITFIMDPFTFTFLWSQANKKADELGGLGFNEFLVDYYIEEIAENFPKVESVIPKVFLTGGRSGALSRLLTSKGRGELNSLFAERDAKKLMENFFVLKDGIVNGIEVGI